MIRKMSLKVAVNFPISQILFLLLLPAKDMLAVLQDKISAISMQRILLLTTMVRFTDNTLLVASPEPMKKAELLKILFPVFHFM